VAVRWGHNVRTKCQILSEHDVLLGWIGVAVAEQWTEPAGW
jgi:hypothetical protein